MKRQWENEELIEHWMLSAWDRTQLGNKTGATRLGFAILLKFFQRAGRFPAFKNEVPSTLRLKKIHDKIGGNEEKENPNATPSNRHRPHGAGTRGTHTDNQTTSE